MVDRIKPLKIETATDGTEMDFLPTEADPNEDYIATKGIAFENNNNRLVDLDGSGNIQFKDVTETTPINVRQLRTASNNIFDNSSNDFLSTNVQDATEEAVFNVDNVLFVNKGNYPGHFSTLKDALASILDSDAYTILIGPGVYIEDNSISPIILKPGVTIQAIGSSTVIIEPQDANKDLILINEQNCRIQGITIRNVTGAKAVSVTSSPTPAIFDVITIQNCKIGVFVQSDQTISQVVFRNLRIISGSTTEYLIKIEALDNLDSIVRIYSAILTDSDGTSFIAGIHLSGLGSRIDPNTVLLRSDVGNGAGIIVDDGGHIQLTSGAEITGFNNGLVFEDTGVAPTFQIQSMTIRESITNDINIIHTSTTGSFFGIARRSNIINNATTTALLNYIDPDSANLNNSGMLITRGLSPELTTITTDGNTHQLTRFSTHATIFTGSTANTILKLPNATTFSKTGHLYDIWNFSSVSIEIHDFDDNLLATILPNGHTLIILRDISSTAGIWGLTYTVDNGNIFGSEIHFAEDDSETSTTSNTIYSTKVTLTTPASLPLGNYLLNFQFIWRSSNADREMDVRIREDNTTTLSEWVPSTSRIQNEELVSGFIKIDNISGEKDFTLEFKRGTSTGSATIYMKQARLYIWRIV